MTQENQSAYSSEYIKALEQLAVDMLETVKRSGLDGDARYLETRYANVRSLAPKSWWRLEVYSRNPNSGEALVAGDLFNSLGAAVAGASIILGEENLPAITPISVSSSIYVAVSKTYIILITYEEDLHG